MQNQYLQGPYAPVDEELTTVDLPVTGSIPEGLDGRYLRNGPNPVTPPDPATYHWFTGTGMVHGIRLADGEARWYRNRFVRAAEVAEALGEPPHPGPVHADMDFAPNTHVMGHAGRTFALVEAGARPYELTEELDTVGACDFEGTLPGGYTAHPLRDPTSGELHALSYFWGWGNKVQYSVLGTDGRIRRTVDIEVSGSPMMHAFTLTERYVVIYDLPVAFNLELAATSDFPYAWDLSYPARVGVLPREGDAEEVRWFDVEPCYVFHPVNGYDDGDEIVLDVIRYQTMFATDLLGPNEGLPTLDRWTLDLAAGKVKEARLDERGQEFPRIDERLIGRQHRHAYSVCGDGAANREADLSLINTVLKQDLTTGHSETRSFGTNDTVGEFVFVPATAEAGEDEGVLMGLVYDAESDASNLTILDAATLDDVATVHLPVRVPLGFHGSWIPSPT